MITSVFKGKARNMKFEFYYQNILKMEVNEHENFMRYLNMSLPCILRVNKLNKHFEHFHKSLVQLAKTNEIEIRFIELSSNEFYRNQILELRINKQQLKKVEQFAEIHKFIDDSAKLGVVSRQELVSMLPPMLLHPVPGNTVIDMCAAPGGKTKQIIESIFSSDDGKGKINV